MSEKPQKKTSALVAAGAALFVAMRWSQRVIGLVSTIVLARLLSPEDFGIVSICTGYFLVLDSFTDFGLRTAIIRDERADRSFLDTVFTLQLLRGILLAAVVVLSSLFIPDIVGDQRLRPVIQCMAVLPLIAGFLNTYVVLFERDLDFRRETAIQVSSKVVSTAASITAAILLKSYWALVIGLILGSLARVFIGYALAPALPRLHFKDMRKLLHFSGWLSGSYMLDAAGKGFDNMIIASFRSVPLSGLYNVGQQLAEMPLGEFLPAINRALFPGLMRFRDAADKLKANALEATGFLASLSLPMGVGFAFVAPEFVHLVYGPKWLGAIPLVQVLAASYAFETIGGSIAQSIGMVAGKTRLLFFRSLFRTAVRLPAFAIGAWLFGLSGALAGSVLGSLVLVLTNLSLMRTLIGVTYFEIGASLWRTAVALTAMACALFLLQSHLPAEGGNLELAFNIIAKMVVGGGAYALARLCLYKLGSVPDSLDARLISFYKSRRLQQS